MGKLRAVVLAVVPLLLTAAPASASNITIPELPPNWQHVDFSYTVTEPGFFGDLVQVGDVFSGYVRWSLDYWDPAITPHPTDDCDRDRIGTCFEVVIDVPDGVFDVQIEHDSWDDEVTMVDGVWGRTEIWFAWDIESFGTEWLTLYGDFFSGGPVTGGDWHISSRHGEPRFVGSVNPHAVPEPSTLAALIAGCLALAIGRRSGVL